MDKNTTHQVICNLFNNLNKPITDSLVLEHGLPKEYLLNNRNSTKGLKYFEVMSDFYSKEENIKTTNETLEAYMNLRSQGSSQQLSKVFALSFFKLFLVP